MTARSGASEHRAVPALEGLLEASAHPEDAASSQAREADRESGRTAVSDGARQFVQDAARRFDAPFTLRQALAPVLDSPLTIRRTIILVFALGLFLWIPIVAARGVFSAVQVVADAVAGIPRWSFATPPSIWAALLVYLFCLGAALVTRRQWPAFTLPATFLAGSLVVLVGAVGTGSAGALAVVVAMMALAWLVGQAVLHRFPDTARVPVVRVPLSIALGFGLLGLLLFLLTGVQMFNSRTILVSAVAILVLAIVVDRAKLAEDVRRFRAWQPAVPSWFETAVIGMTVGLAAYAILAAFAPENMYDPFRQHVPIAREIWQSGSIPVIPTMGVTKDPVQGHLLFAVGWGFAGMTATKLVNTAVGLVAIAGIAGLGWLCAGRAAAVVSAAIFTATTIVLWELGHTYTDMFAVMFTVTAALGVLLWQRDGKLVWLLGAGALAGFGLASKMTMGWLIIALAAGIFLVGNGPWRWRDRFLAVSVFGVGTLVVVPWLVRSYVIAGEMPAKLAILVNFITSIIPGIPAIVPPPVAPGFVQLELDGLAIGHSPFDLLRVPWVLTFESGLYPNSTIGPGEIGILLLLMAPLAILGLRNRSALFLAVTALVSYLVWWLTPLQITRHVLPTLAVGAALAGAGFAYVVANPSRVLRAVAPVAKGGLLVGIVTAPLFFLPGSYSHVGGASQAPVDLITRRESADEFVRREIPAGTALLATSGVVPADAPLGYIGKWGGAQLYTEARLVNIGQFTQIPVDEQFGTTPEEILANLEQLGIRYFVWDRPVTKEEDWQSTMLSTDFLFDHTRIVEGDRSAYLFEVLPEGGSWGIDDRSNLFVDPGFEKIRRDSSAWKIEGHIARDEGLISPRGESVIAQKVPVTAGQAYVMTIAGACERETDAVQLRLTWLDEQGATIETTTENVIPGEEPSTQFIWHRAPDAASAVNAEIWGSEGRNCTISNAGFYQTP